MHSVREVLGRPWVLDIDASVKPLYGRQEGGRDQLQPGQTQAAQPCAAHLPGGQPATGAGCAGQLGQAAHQRTRQGGAGAAAGRTRRQAPGAVARRIDGKQLQLYRDRADAENAFDELKNQWALGGFTTQDMNRCQTTRTRRQPQARLATQPPAGRRGPWLRRRPNPVKPRAAS